jgi:hypothetical protein
MKATIEALIDRLELMNEGYFLENRKQLAESLNNPNLVIIRGGLSCETPSETNQ